MALRTENCTGSPPRVCVTGPNHADPVGDDSPIIVDTVRKTVHVQPQYFYLGQFSKFLPVNSTRVDAVFTNGTSSSRSAGAGTDAARAAGASASAASGRWIQVVAFATPPASDTTRVYGYDERKVVVVVMNQSGQEAAFTLALTAAAAGVSSGELEGCAAGGDLWWTADVTVPEHSIQTYVAPLSAFACSN